uniref:Uncharacterized protein n=1 Tax=Arundo donax TaxID=35708 RepID=A0A0A9B1R0_ARUDO
MDRGEELALVMVNGEEERCGTGRRRRWFATGDLEEDGERRGGAMVVTAKGTRKLAGRTKKNHWWPGHGGEHGRRPGRGEEEGRRHGEEEGR